MGSHYKIRTEKTGHYFQHGTILPTTRYVWICLHGYGQLAKQFIQKFEFLDPDLHWVIAPEGLNRFYFEGVRDRPVASWMTSEDRLDEISDYILFLETLRHRLAWDKNTNTRIIYCGFSQGVSTIFRWLHDAKPRVDQLVLWAGSIPEDIQYDHLEDYLGAIKTTYFLGDKDPYIPLSSFEEKKGLAKKIGLNASFHVFQGEHRLDENVLKEWVEENLNEFGLGTDGSVPFIP